MSNTVRSLEPKAVWNFFEDLNAVPRPSKKEEQVIAFMRAFAMDRNLDVKVDRAGNVIIYKPATKGMENRKKVVLQSHLDMVHQKNDATQFDFLTEGIRSFIEGEFVTADGTTLGADNGMGVAAMMSVLDSDDIEHPELVALFTIDEETGMTGAFDLEADLIEADIMLNLDTENDDEFSVGCAGGIDTNIRWNYSEEKIAGIPTYKIRIEGLKGGHSGLDIHKGLANANKLFGRMLNDLLEHEVQLVSLDGGSLRNAIPREGTMIVASSALSEDLLQAIKVQIEEISNELSIAEPNLSITVEQIDSADKAMSKEDTRKLTLAIHSTVNGVYRMSDAIPGLVETSSSLSRIIVEKGEVQVMGLQRSSLESGKMDVAYAFAAPYHLIGADVEHSGSYPGWAPNPKSEILALMTSIYEKNYGSSPRVQACHAGLECGILSEHFPKMDMISFGPTIQFPHSPDERVEIKSVKKFWDLLLVTLKNIPLK